MKIINKLILGTVLFFLVFSMFQISLEIGLVSLVLVCAVVCIWIVLKKITTVVVHSKLIPTSSPFKDSNGPKNDILVESKTSTDSGNLFPGVNADIFDQFREKLNLNTTPNNQVSQDSQDTGDSLSNEDFSSTPENNHNQDLVTEAYQKAVFPQGPANFSEELEEVEQVKVTLSENAKLLQNNHRDKTKNDLEDDSEDKHKINEEKESHELEKRKDGNNDQFDTNKKLGSGEAALELLSRKHQTLKEQTDRTNVEHVEDFDEDLFADELIPIPGGENYADTDSQIFSDEDTFPPLSGTYSLEEDPFGSSLQGVTSKEEKFAEAETLLKLATRACETDRIDEAKASLESYLKILKELRQKPTADVLQLAEKLEITIESSKAFTEVPNNDLSKTESDEIKELPLENIPEETNYSNVMDGIVKSLEEKEAYEEAIPLLKDLLNYNRKRVNISAMDPLYDRIEQAHSSMQNDEELVATYKEHLAIKQQLGDIEGELHLLDLISYFYANTGDQKASERYQEESKRIKARLDNKIEDEE